MREASIRSRKSGEKNISANSVRKVTEVGVLFSCVMHIWVVMQGIADIDYFLVQKTLRKFQG